MLHQTKLILSALGLIFLFSQHVNAADSTLLIGRLTQQSYCQNKQWIDPHYEIGFVPVVLDAKYDPSAFVQKMVIAKGTVDSSIPPKKLSAGFSCDQEAQSRGDWVWGQDGQVRGLRDVPAWMRKQLKWNEFETPTVRVDSIKTFSGLTAKLEGKDLVVGFTNTLGKDLNNITLKAHYEGCYGKPGAAEQEKSFSLVVLNQAVVARFPITVIDEKQIKTSLGDRSQHVISSIQIVSGDKDVWFDFDASVRGDLGVSVECPKK